MVLSSSNPLKMSVLRVAFVGSGAVNFGGTEGPWDHSARLERLGGVEVVAIVDPLVGKARAVLERKLAGPHCDLYRDCIVLASCSEVFAMKEERRPQAAFIGWCVLHADNVTYMHH